MITLKEFKNEYWHKTWHDGLTLIPIKEYKEYILIEKLFDGEQLVSPQRMLINRFTGGVFMWQKKNNNINYSKLGHIWNGYIGHRDFNYEETDIEYLLNMIMIEQL